MTEPAKEFVRRTVVVDKPLNYGLKFNVKGGLLRCRKEVNEEVLQDIRKVVVTNTIELVSNSESLTVRIPVYRGYWIPLYQKTWDKEGVETQEMVGVKYENNIGLDIRIVFYEP